MNKKQRSLVLVLLVAVGVSIGAVTSIAAQTSLPQVKKVQVVNIDSAAVTVRWQKVTSAKKYQVRVLNNDKTLLNQLSTKKTNRAVTGLQSDTSYYVKVRAVRGEWKGKWSKLKQFTTQADNNDADDNNDNDDDTVTQPTVDFSVNAYSGTESAGAITVTVNLSAAATVSVTVDYATSDGTATAGTDYTAASGTVTFAAGDITETFLVSPTSDTTNESDETVLVTLANASGASIGSTNNPATVTITDDDSLTISSPSFSDGGTIPITFTCDGPGGGVSPELNWVSAPSGTQSFFLLVIDIDASDFVHWSVKSIPTTTAGAAQSTDPAGGTNLPNSWGNPYYQGPCPPLADGAHTYEFTIYALDIDALTSATVSEALTELSTHILEQHTITGEYDA